MATDPNKVIYSMIKVSKKYNQKYVLKDISLSYFYGAKIGVLGLNGSGKSTLLRILAGIDREHEGKTILSEGYTIDYLPQEPELDGKKTVRQIVEEVRMAVALSQLQSTRLPIGEIALQCGYLSSSRFTARFRQHYGCLPKTLR